MDVSTSDSVSTSSSSDVEPVRNEPRKKKIKFSPAQISCLKAMYDSGMKSAAEKDLPLIKKAAKDAKLDVLQVKRWIKKTNYIKRHGKRRARSVELPCAKHIKITPWQFHSKEFGNTKAGKEPMIKGPGMFNKAASLSYRSLNQTERAQLKEACIKESSKEERMSAREVMREGKKVFSKIQCLFKELEKMKYRCIAFGFFEDDVQVVTTTDCSSCISPRCIEYIRAITVVANPPPLPSVLPDKLPETSATVPKLSSNNKQASRKSPAPSRQAPSSRKFSSKQASSSIKPQAPSSKRPPSSRKSPAPSSSLPHKSPGPSPKQPPSSNKSSSHKSSSRPPPSSAAPSSKQPPSSPKSPAPSSKRPPSFRKSPAPSSSLPHKSPGPSPKQPPSSNKSSSRKSSSRPPPSSPAPSSKQPPSSPKSPAPSSKQPPSSPKSPSPPSKQPPSSSKSPSPPSKQPPSSPMSPTPAVTCSLESSSEALSQPMESSSSPSDNVVVLSESPVKISDDDIWISSLSLYIQDRTILQTSGSWLNDNLIYAAQMLLNNQSKIEGFQSTQFGKKLAFSTIPPYTKYIQILHVDGNHWNVVSNIRSDGGVFTNSVCIYDSLYMHVALDTKKQICSFVRPKNNEFTFDIANTQHQTNSSDCGLFAIAFATELVHSQSPVLCEFNTSMMRNHLLTCLQNGVLTRFPLKKVRRVPMGSKVRKSIKELIYCSCRMPNDKKLSMVRCDDCAQWFHYACEGLMNSVDVAKRWVCSKCMHLQQSLQKNS